MAPYDGGGATKDMQPPNLQPPLKFFGYATGFGAERREKFLTLNSDSSLTTRFFGAMRKGTEKLCQNCVTMVEGIFRLRRLTTPQVSVTALGVIIIKFSDFPAKTDTRLHFCDGRL